MKQFLCIPCYHLANRGYNAALEVYQIKKNKISFIGGNYEINTASWRGYKAEAILVVCKVLGHKHDGYNFISKNLNMSVV